MAYADVNFKTKSQLRAAVKGGQSITVYQPGGQFPLQVRPDGTVFIEGPWFPEPHRWYATATVDADGRITRVR